jgi:hypothetical protein
MKRYLTSSHGFTVEIACYVMLKSSKKRNFPHRYRSHNPRGKSPMALGLVILGDKLENCLFQSNYSRSIHLKTDISIMWGIPSCWNNTLLIRQLSQCSVLIDLHMSASSQLLLERKQSNDLIFHRAPQHVNRWHVLTLKTSWGSWLPQIQQLRLLKIPFMGNAAS